MIRSWLPCCLLQCSRQQTARLASCALSRIPSAQSTAERMRLPICPTRRKPDDFGRPFLLSTHLSVIVPREGLASWQRSKPVKNSYKTISFGGSTILRIPPRDTGSKRTSTTCAHARAILTRRSIASRFRSTIAASLGRKRLRRVAPNLEQKDNRVHGAVEIDAGR